MKKSHLLVLTFLVNALIFMDPFLCSNTMAGVFARRMLDIDRCVTDIDNDECIDPSVGDEPACEACTLPEIEDFTCQKCVCISPNATAHTAFLIKFTINGFLGPFDADSGQRGLQCDDLDEYDLIQGTSRSILFDDITIEVERVIRAVEEGCGDPAQCFCTRGKENVKITITSGGTPSYAQKKRTFGVGEVGATDFDPICCDFEKSQATTILIPATAGGVLNFDETAGCLVRLLYQSDIFFDVENPCDGDSYLIQSLRISGIEDCKCDPPTI